MCSKILGPNTSIKRHIAAVHLKIKNHECKVCSKRFFRKNDLKNHVLRHVRRMWLKDAENSHDDDTKNDVTQAKDTSGKKSPTNIGEN